MGWVFGKKVSLITTSPAFGDVVKNWENCQFHHGPNFCSAKYRQDSPIFPESTRLYHSKLIIELVGGILR
jgi:hypothetical protein